MHTPHAVIEASGLGKVFARNGRAVTALDGIDFSVQEGSFVSLVGPSGCGKSTLLSIVAGLAPPTSGKVLIDGSPITGPMPGKVAVVFQDALLLPWRSALSNVELPLEVRGESAGMRREKARAMLALVGLVDAAERYPHELSGGMRQRVAIARGLVQDPQIVLMDEPFGALDEQTRTRMGDELLRIWEAAQKTVLFVTHSLTEALYLSDRVFVMGRNPGRIIETVTVDMLRPRHIEMIGSAKFGSARNHIWRLIGQDADPSQSAGNG